MTFKNFNKIHQKISNVLDGVDENEKIGFKIKLNDGDIIEFYKSSNKYWDSHFIIDNDDAYISVLICDKKKDEKIYHCIPCDIIDYITLILPTKIDDSLISW